MRLRFAGVTIASMREKSLGHATTIVSIATMFFGEWLDHQEVNQVAQDALLILWVSLAILSVCLYFHAWFMQKQTHSSVLVSVPQRTTMVDLLKLTDHIGKKITEPDSHILDFTTQFNQAAADGIFTVWGRPVINNQINHLTSNERLQPIPKEHWYTHRFDWVSAVDLDGPTLIIKNISDENIWTRTYDSAKQIVGFADLHVDSTAAENWVRNSQFALATSESNSERYIPLAAAVMDVWERIRNLREFNERPAHSPEYATLRDYYERDPDKLYGIVAQIVFNNADPPITIEGMAPPRTTIEKIPEAKAMEYRFSDDAKELFDIFDTDKAPGQRRRFINLRVNPSDIERRVQAIEGENSES